MKKIMMIFLTTAALIGIITTSVAMFKKPLPLLFGIFNRTPHKVYIRMAFDKKKCATFTQEIPANGSAYVEHTDCYVTLVSGYIYIDGKSNDLIRWENKRGSTAASWKIEMEPDGKTAKVGPGHVDDERLNNFYKGRDEALLHRARRNEGKII